MASKCLDPDVWKNWDRQGKMSFTKACQECVKDNTSETSPLLSKSGASIGLTRLIHDLVWNGINGILRKDAVVGALKDILLIHKDLPSIVLDVLGVIDGETSCTDNTSEERQRFCLLMKETEKFIAEKLLKERLEIETLQDIGTLKNKNFYTKFIKVKTKLYYKQKKFNLFREESEGYSKLVSELNQEVSENVTVKKMLEVIISLVGCFNLDPNRVLDVILESFECHPERHQLFIPLLQFYNPDAKTLCEVLGFKYCYYQSSAEETTPKTLYTLTALMIQHGIIALEDIFCWLVPDNRSIQRAWDAEMKAAKEFVRKLNILSTKDKEAEEPPEEVEDVVRLFNANQKYGLCEALLLVGDWTHAEQLTRKFPEYCAMEQPPIARATIRLVHSLIEPVYRRNTGLPSRFNGDLVPPPTSPLAPQPATNLAALRDNVFPMLLALGPWLHYDAALMYKVLRVSKVILTNVEKEGTTPPSADSLYYDVITLIDDVILPSLSFMECNCCIAEEVWDVLKLLPYQCRYCLYSRWKNETYLQHSKLLRKRGEGEKKIKAIMKRVSKDTTKPVGRLLGKLTHCAPGCLFDYVLVQIQMYDNLINPVVDSLKYLTSLSYDVLGYCLVETLASADKDRLMHDGTSLSLWLQSLAAFCGAMFKKYNIELTGLLQYVCNQLKAKKSLDLLILKEIIQKMAGIEAAEEMTNDQLEAMAGGDLLKAEAGYFSQVRNTKKSSQRLKESLNVDNLAVALCLSMAQQRYGVVYKETERNHLKLVGKLYDQCQDALVQFGTFLGMTLSVEEYVAKLPTINSMLADYHIHADVAFFLARPMFTHAITLQFEGMRKADSNWKKLSLAAKHQKYCEAASEVMSPIVTSVRPLHAAKVWEDISPQFLVTFWSLTMYDLFVPADSYQREVNKLKAQAMQAADSKEMSSSSSKGKKEQERFASMVDKLQDEKKKQAEHVEKVMSRLKLEKDSWFLSRSAKSAKNETITQFLQLCLFPRCIFTAVDAVYCAKFVHTIHSLKTANFSTLLCYDRLFCDITYSVTSCTENEANRYGRFLCAMLETVMRWHADKATFDRECSNYPGFVTKFRVSNQFSEANDHVGYENYRHVCHKWHYKITKAMVVCLDSKDYVQIRNSLIILIKIMPHFPVLAKLGQIIEKKIEKVREEEKAQRQDLYILATSYSGQLKAKAANMIRENDFHQVSEKVFKVHEVAAKAESNGVAPGAAGAVAGGKQVNGEAKEAKKEAAGKEAKAEKRTSSRAQETKAAAAKKESTPGKEKPDKVKDKDQEGKEKPVKVKKEKEDRRDDEKRKEKKEASAQREERGYRESERYTEMPLSKEDPRYYSSGGGGSGGGNAGGGGGGSYYAMAAHDDRELSSVSNSSGGSHRRSQEPPEVEREAKRRKVDGSTSASKMSKHEERRQQQQQATMQDQPPTSTSSSSTTEKPEKRMSKTKDKSQREKNTATEEEKELRKERKLGRKRDRAEEAQLAAEQKRRKEEDKALKAAHQNGEQLQEQREKHHYAREKSPYARERSHERDGRDKQRSGGETKRR